MDMRQPIKRRSTKPIKVDKIKKFRFLERTVYSRMKPLKKN